MTIANNPYASLYAQSSLPASTLVRRPLPLENQNQPPEITTRTTPVKTKSEVHSPIVEQVQQAQLRADQYLAAARELKSTQIDPKLGHASKTFLEIAHYETEQPLVDIYV